MIKTPARLGRRAMLAVAAGLFPAIARGALPPITDAMGRSVTLRGPAERIVLGFNYEEFTAIAGPAGWQRVVGFNRRQWAVNRTSLWERYQKVIPGLTSVADIGELGEGSFSLETVLGLRPDLMVVIAYDYKANAAVMQRIEAAGIPVLVLDYQAQDVERHVAGTLALGAAVGEAARARELAELYRSKVADVARRIAGRRPPPAYFELGSGGPGVIGNTYNGAMWGRLVETAGGANIAAGRIGGPWGPMAPEAVLAARPEFVFLTGSAWANASGAIRTGYDVDEATARARLIGYTRRPGWAGLPAVAAGDVFAIDAGLSRALWDWTGMQFIGKQMHPEAFADVDPVASLRDYHAAYLPVAFDGTWMLRLGKVAA